MGTWSLGFRGGSAHRLCYAPSAIRGESDAAIAAVIHVHDLGLWQKLLYKVPTTSKEIEYGTPGMAYEVRRLFRETDVSRLGIIAMAGHEEGIFTFGSNLGEAFERLMSYYEEMS